MDDKFAPKINCRFKIRQDLNGFLGFFQSKGVLTFNEVGAFIVRQMTGEKSLREIEQSVRESFPAVDNPASEVIGNVSMKLQFLYSKNKEKEKLLNIYDEYQWFIDNDFPIVLPEFYNEIYKNSKKNKKHFSKQLDAGLNKVYNRDNYQFKSEAVKSNWRKIEKEFFEILNNFNLKVRDKYFCHISLYGPEGQFNYPDVVNLRVANSKDIKNTNETIAHEIIHLLIYNKAKKLKLNYQQTEGIVDLCFIETKLKDIFPKYKIQNIGIGNKKLFHEIIKIKNSLK